MIAAKAENDRDGTVLRLTDAAGAVVWAAEARAFLEAVPAAATNTADTPLRGSSQRLQSQTGLHYNGLRWYAPSLGRYLSTDPLLGVVNRAGAYHFADNSPLLVQDRKGADVGAGIAIAIGGDGTVTGGVSGSVGAYEGLGGELSGGLEVTNSDCCKIEPGKPRIAGERIE